MQRYYVEAETPLKFHKFLCVVLWINAIAVGWQLINVLDLLDLDLFDSDSMTALIILCVYGIPALGFRFAAAWGLRTFTKYSWYCVVSFNYWDMGFCFLCVILANIMDISMTEVLVQGIVAGIYAVLFHIYYAKRKPLFFKPQARVENRAYDAAPYVTPPMHDPTAYRPAVSTPSASAAAQEILFCRQCGKKLAPGSSFCGKCGTPISRPEN